MESLSDKSSCPRCQRLLLVDYAPKVLPGCLHVLCLHCLNDLPIAFLTNSSANIGSSEDQCDDSVRDSGGQYDTSMDSSGSRSGTNMGGSGGTRGGSDGQCGKSVVESDGLGSWSEADTGDSLSCSEWCSCQSRLSVDEGVLILCEGRKKKAGENMVGESGRKRSASVVVHSRGSNSSLCRRCTTNTLPLSHRPLLQTSGQTSENQIPVDQTPANETSSTQVDSSLIPEVTLTVQCPKCNRASLLPSQGFEGLPTSYVVSNMASTCRVINELREKLPEGKCEQCVKESTAIATSYCRTCQQLICKDHTRCHKMWRDFANHRFFPVESLSPGTGGDMDSAAIKLLTPSLDLGVLKCSKHSQKPDNQLKFFCCTCEDLACSYCTVSEHRDGEEHCCVSVTSELVSEKRATVEHSLQQLDSLARDVNDLTNDVRSQQENIAKKALEVKDRIDAVFTEVIDTLRSRQHALHDVVDSLLADSLKKLENCTKKVSFFRQHVMECQGFVQDNLTSDGSLGFLSVAGVVSEHSTSLCDEYSQLLPECKVPVPDIEFAADTDNLYNAISAFGNVSILQPLSSYKSLAKTRAATVRSLYKQLRKIKSPTLTCTLQDMASVESTTDIFNANLMDSMTGSYVYPTLNFTVAGGGSSSDIGSPVIIEIPKISGIYVRSLEGLERPSGIRVDSNFRLVVCEFGTHQVVTLDPSGCIVNKLGKEGDKNGHFLYPQSTECDNAGKMLVVDSIYRMQMFDCKGKFLRSVGTKGRGRLQFMDPVSIAISQDKQVFICERENHRIQVLDRELTFQRFIGERGRKDCEFYLPTGIAISDSGYLFVADSGNHRIQVLSLDGAFVRSFGRKGSTPGELCLPSHICVDLCGVYVSEEGNHRVSVFTQTGVFIQSIGEKGSGLGQFLRPLGVAIDQNKTLYVCDSRNKRIQIFK